MPDRLTALSTSATAVTGAAYMDDLGDEVRSLWDRVHSVLSGVGGTANAVTATVTPALGSRGLQTGMLFSLTAAASNTGAMTLSIGGLAASPILQMSGQPVITGQVVAGSTYLLAWTGAAFVLLTATQQPRINDRQLFDAVGSFSWVKPAGCPDNALVRVRLWGGGGGGARCLIYSNVVASGGGGGAYVEEVIRAGDLPSSVSVVVGAGGATGYPNGGAGETTSFGLVAAPGGGGGNAQQFNGTSIPPVTSAAGGSSPAYPAGAGSTSASYALVQWSTSWAISSVGPAYYGGGCGGGARNRNDGVYTNTAPATTSTRGGAGGAPGQPGAVPAGGGGVDAAGARGRAEIITQG